MQLMDYFVDRTKVLDLMQKSGTHKTRVQLLDRLRKTRLTVSLCFIFAGIVFLTAIARLLAVYPTLDLKVFVLFIICAYFITLPFIYKWTNNDFILKFLLLSGGTLGIFIRALSTAGLPSSPFYWLCLVPLSSALIFEKRMIIWSLLLSVILAIVLYYGGDLGLFMGAPNTKLANLAGFMGLLFACTFTAVAFDRQATNFQEVLVRREREIQDSKKLASLGNMAAGVAHEVNNPLMIISGNLHILEKMVNRLDINQEEQFRMIRTLEKATNNIQRINNIVQSLLAYSRMKSKDNFRYFTINELVAELKKITEGIGIYHQITWPEHEDLIETIQGDFTLLTQVFTNLIHNAAQATRELPDNSIHISFHKSGAEIYFKVVDRGVISKQEIIENMFNPFFTTKPVGEGTGLGLSLSKGIVEMHGGDLYYDTRAKTTTFIVKLPIS